MVGALTAAALAECGFDVSVVESARPTEFDNAQPYDLRVSALSVASVHMLEAVDAWPSICAMRACPFRRMAVWDGTTGTETRFNSADIGQSRLGYIVENRVIQLGLWQTLERSQRIEVCCPASIDKYVVEGDGVRVLLDDGRSLQAGLLIAADGANSSLRTMAGIGCEGEAYDQHALVVSVRTAMGQQDITWQRFMPAGPQALLPLTENRASLVWYESASAVAELKSLKPSQLLERIEADFPSRLGELEAVEAVGSFPIRWSQARSYIAERLALVGDAAHTVHPLAGQGVNMGMLDASALVEVLVQARQKRRDPGRRSVLRRYERWRKGENALMIKALDATHHIFEPAGSTSRVLRNTALAAAAGVSPVNRLLMKVAMGLVGDLPSLAHGVVPGRAA